MSLDCLILAAGASRRFGTCKLLEPWQGQPLIHRPLHAALDLAPARLLVITGAYGPALASTLAQDFPQAECHYYSGWERGMGASLAFGVSLLTAERPLLVLLGDQPLITSARLRQLYALWLSQPDSIACASFAQTRGVPAIFPPGAKAQLRQLDGDRGAKHLLGGDDVVCLTLPEAARDIDTHSDFTHLTQGHHHDFAHS